MPNEIILQRDSRWRIFYGDVSLQDFIAKLPEIRFFEDVNPHVKEAFGIVYKLMVHSYYEYFFIDAAVTKALQSFEMALKLRYKELNNLDWTRNLAQLIEHFRKNSYFELDRKDFLDHVRKTRNHLSHPERHNIGGTVWLHWISTTVDLINDLYEDVNLRKQRKALSSKVIQKLKSFIQNGAKLKYQNEDIIIYDLGHVLLNNLAQSYQVTFSLLKVFDLKSTEVRWPLVITCEIDALKLDSELILIDQEGNKIVLTNDLDENQKDYTKTFKSNIVHDTEMLMNHNSLLFDSQNIMTKEWRQIRHSRK